MGMVGDFLAIAEAVGAAPQVFDRRRGPLREPAPGGDGGHQQHGHDPGQQRRRLDRHAAQLGGRDADQNLPADVRHRTGQCAHGDAVQGVAVEHDCALGCADALPGFLAQERADILRSVARARDDPAIAVGHGGDPGRWKLLARKQLLDDADVQAQQQVVAHLALDAHRHLHHEIMAPHRRRIKNVGDPSIVRAEALAQCRQVGRVAPRHDAAQRAPRIQDRLARHVVKNRHRAHALGRAPRMGIKLVHVAFVQRRRGRQRAQDALLVPHLVVDEQRKRVAGFRDAALLILLLLDVDIGHRQGRADEGRHEDGDDQDQEPVPKSHAFSL